jgi:O-antigen ligase
MLEWGLTQYIPVLAYAACMVVAVVTLFHKAKIGLYFITFLVPLQNLLDKLIPFPFGKNIMDILVIATLISVFVHRDRHVPILRGGGIFRPVLLFVLISYSSLWIGYMKFGFPMPISLESQYLIRWRTFVVLPVLYFLTLGIIKEKKEIVVIIWIMIVSVFIMDVYFYNDWRGTDYSYYRADLRTNVASTFSYLGPNELATYLSMMALFLIGCLSVDKLKMWKLVFLGVSVFNFYCILFLFSRGAYIACVAGILFLGLIKKRILLLLLVVLFFSWHSILPNAVVERIEMTQTEEGLDSSSERRVGMWSRGLEAVRINPITGVGFGATDSLNIENTSRGQGIRRNIHNGYLTVLIEQGILGLVVLLYIFAIAVKKGWDLYKKAGDDRLKGLGLGFLSMMVVSLIDNLTGSNWCYLNVMGHFWIIFGLVAKGNEISLSEKENVETDC